MPIGKSLLSQHAHPFEPEEKRAKDLEQETKRLYANSALQERNLYEEKYGFRPRTVQVEYLLDSGGALEDAGRYEAAVKMYQKALALEPQHHELRKYIELLNIRLNAYAVMDKQKERQKALAQHMDSSSCQHATLSLPSAATCADRPRGRAGTGPPVPLSPAAYGAELRRQAAQQAQHKAAAKKQDEQLDRMVLDAARHCHEQRQYHDQVNKAHQELLHNRVCKAAMEERRQQRIERHLEEHGMSCAAVKSDLLGMAGPLQGLGERHKMEMAARALHQQHYPAPRPQSSGPPGVGRVVHPGQYHEVVTLRPSSAVTQYRNGGTSLHGGAKSKVVQAPFARPSVDNPVAAINPCLVRARQQTFYDKHRKKS